MERPHTGKNSETNEDERETPILESGAEMGGFKGDQIEGTEPRLEINRQQADQPQRAPSERVEHQFHRAILFAGAAPDGDDEIFRDDGDFIEDEKEKDIDRKST